MFRSFLKRVKVGLAVFFLILAILFTGELIRFFLLMYRINPVAAWVYFWLVGGLLAMSLAFLIWQFLRLPRVPVPPPIAHPMGHLRMRRYCRYLRSYLRYLAANPSLTTEQREPLLNARDHVREVLAAHPLNEDLERVIRQTEEQVILPTLAILNERGAEEVRRSVRDVMLAVTLSPYPAMDLLIVLYRNLAMITRLIRLYHGWLPLREHARILWDVLLTIAAVKVLNLSRKLFESLLSEVPLLGRVLENIGQGAGAGLMTSLAGHAAMARCAAFRGWDREQEALTLSKRVGVFLGDVRDLFTKDLLPQLRGLIRSGAPPGMADQPGFWDSITRGMTTAIETTSCFANALLVKPAVAVGAGVYQAGSYLTRGAMSAGETAVRITRRGARHARHGVGRVLHTFAQRIFYTLRGPRFFG